MTTAYRLLADPAGPAGLVTRDGARDAAHREVSRQIYHAHQPGIWRQLLNRAADWLGNLFDHAAGVAPGGGAGALAILLLLIAAVILLLWRTGPLGRAGRRGPLDDLGAGRLEAADHRAAADAHAAAGRYAEAIRERMRAIARELEARGVLEVRPGRTADEVAADAGGQLPMLAGHLRSGVRIFDEVWYGGRAATAESDAALGEIDRLIHRTPLRMDAPVPPGPPMGPQGPVTAR